MNMSKSASQEEDRLAHELLGRTVKGLVIIPAMAAVNFFLHGFVASYLWTWFVTPVFGMPSPGLLYCIGLCMMAKYVSRGLGIEIRDKTDEEKIRERSMLQILTLTLIGHTLVLGSAWVLHLFV